MQELLTTLLFWIGVTTGYDVDINLPNITLTEPNNICSNYGINKKGQCEAAKLLGFYNKKYTIYLPNDFDPENQEHIAYLAHELTHYVQWENGSNKTMCLGQLEVEAYEVQDNWRTQHNLAESFDPFNKILLAASCDT